MLNDIQMVKAIAEFSSNDLCKNLCKAILDKSTSIELEKERGHGSFISAVLDGDYPTALARADMGNRVALLKGNSEPSICFFKD